MESILKVEHLEKYYGNRGNVTKAVDDISFTVTQGEYIGIMGASGSGKTTLLNCISTIDSATAGHIFIRGQDVTQLKAKELSRFRREQLGFIFQEFNLLDTLTAFENIALALTVIGTPAKEIDGRVHNVAKRLEIDSILGKYPYQLSGGQQQRVASARAMSQPGPSIPNPPACCSRALKRSTASSAPQSSWSRMTRLRRVTANASFSSKMEKSLTSCCVARIRARPSLKRSSRL